MPLAGVWLNYALWKGERMERSAKKSPMALGSRLYRLARVCSRAGMAREALRLFCCAFLLRNSAGTAEEDWLTFFNVQFTSYLLGKRALEVLLPEGDMVYSLIRDRWTALRKEIEASPIRIADLFGWAETVALDFPYGPEDLEAALQDGEPGQDDAVLTLVRN